MTNPICKTQFDSRDLIDYKDFLASELVEAFNTISEDFQADYIDEIFGTDGYEYADDAEAVFATFGEYNQNEIEHYNGILEFCNYLESCDDFNYGIAIIHEYYAEEAMTDMLEDLGYIPKNFPTWIEIDYKATTDNMLGDYIVARYNGDTYYAR